MTDVDGTVHKIVFILKGDAEIDLVDTTIANGGVTKTAMTGLNFNKQETVLKIYIDTYLKVDINGENKFASSSTPSKINAVMFGGALGDCAWDSADSCNVVEGNSQAKYTPYIGSFTTITTGGTKVTWTVLSTDDKGNLI